MPASLRCATLFIALHRTVHVFVPICIHIGWNFPSLARNCLVRTELNNQQNENQFMQATIRVSQFNNDVFPPVNNLHEHTISKISICKKLVQMQFIAPNRLVAFRPTIVLSLYDDQGLITLKVTLIHPQYLIIMLR